MEFTDEMLNTGTSGHGKCQISPRNVELLPLVKICFGTYSMEHYIKPRETFDIE
jgi:hypothetical protein